MNDIMNQQSAGYAALRNRIKLLLEENGIASNTKSWNDYERCKQIVVDKIVFVSASEYTLAMSIISDYVNI